MNLEVPDLATLSQRRSEKWCAHEPGILPSTRARFAARRASTLAWLDGRGLELGEDPAAAFLARGRARSTAGSPTAPRARGSCG